MRIQAVAFYFSTHLICSPDRLSQDDVFAASPRNNLSFDRQAKNMKNLGFQNQSDEVYLLSKKVKNSSLPMLPIIQSNVPRILISNRTIPLKLDETNKMKTIGNC